MSGEFLLDDATVDIETVAPLSVPTKTTAAAVELSLRGWRLPRTFSSLKHANYRYYVAGQLVSQVGTWMTAVAQGWLVYQLTGSPFALGLVGFFGAIPTWFFSWTAGVVVDRVSRRGLLMLTQSIAMLGSLSLAALVFAGVIQPWHIIFIAFLLGMNNSFDITARQTFVKDMVGKEDMLNAIALNSAIFNLSRIIGPTLAGIALALVGPGYCFLIDGLSYLAVIYCIYRMSVPPVVSAPRRGSMLADIKEGLAYIRRHETISSIMIVVAISAVFAVPYTTLLPAYAQDAMHVDASGLGFLSTATGVGALIGALMIASLSHVRRKGIFLTIGNLLYPAALLGLAFSQSYVLSLVLLAIAGWSFMTQQATANTLVQSTVPDSLRGRVMSVYVLASFQGMQPFGAMQAGTIADVFGVRYGIGVGAAIALACGLYLLWRVPRIRHME
jgi:MFS family permease